jgi:hypothetical protein
MTAISDIGISRKGYRWRAQLEYNDQVFVIGDYKTRLDAATAYDMEAMRAYGIDQSKLNFKYEVLESFQKGFKLKDGSGREFFVDKVEKEEYVPITVPTPVLCNPVGNYGNYMSTICSDGAPPRAVVNRPWHKRIVSSYTPSASFCYEITFPHTNSLGLNLRPRCLSYSSGGGQKYMGALVVVEITSLLSSIVSPGDILIRINDKNLVDFGESYDFDKCTGVITSSSAPRLVRFLRPMGPTQLLSAAELSLFLGLPLSSIMQSRSTGPLSPLPPPPAVAKFNVIMSANSQTLQLTYLAPDVSFAWNCNNSLFL